MSENGRMTVIRADASLLAQAQRVFGADLVARAWVSTYYYPKTETTLAVLARLSAAAFKDAGDDTLAYDTETIILEFCNGRRLEFTNSEWASISPLGDYVEM